MIDPTFGIIIASIVAAVPASMAWRESLRGATQESVDTLHDCLNKHTIQDDANFEALKLQISDAQADRDKVAAEAIRVAAELQERVSTTATALAAEHHGGQKGPS